MNNLFNHSPGWIHLKDGPAAKKKFFIQRAPIFIRAVRDVNGKWDVLDLVDDAPENDEEIFVYRQVSWVHIRANRREDGGFHYDYVHHPITGEQKATLRYTGNWRDWAKFQAAAV